MRDPPRSRRAAKPHRTPRRWIRGCRGGRCRCGGDQESEATASRPRTGPSRQASRRRNWARAAGRTYVVSRGPRKVGGPSSSVRPSRKREACRSAARAPLRFPLKRTRNTTSARPGRAHFFARRAGTPSQVVAQKRRDLRKNASRRPFGSQKAKPASLEPPFRRDLKERSRRLSARNA